MSEYRIICVVRDSDGEVEALGYSCNGNGVIYDDRWTLEQAAAVIEEGHRLYTVSPATGEQTDLELQGDLPSSLDLAELPDCGG